MIQDRPNIRIKLRVNFQILVFLFFVAVLPVPGKLYAQSPLPDTIVSLWSSYRVAKDDTSRVFYLSKLAFFYNDYLDDTKKSDSLAEAAIRVAEMSLQPRLMIIAYNDYLASTSADIDAYYQKAVAYGHKALQNCRITNNLAMHWRTCRNLAQVHLSRYNFSSAMSVCNEAMEVATALKDNSLIAETYLFIGGSYECKNEKVEAFRNYLKATDMAEKIENPWLLSLCYSKLSNFYLDAQMFDEAIDFKQKQGKIIMEVRPADSIALMWMQYELQLIDIRQKKFINEQSVRNIIDYAIRKRHDRLKAWEFALYRMYLLESDETVLLYKFYHTTYPEEFKKLFLSDKAMFYRLNAYFRELENQPDSARIYFDKAEQLLINDAECGGIYKSNFYNRYGQFLMRHGRNKEAIEKFTRSFELARADDYNGKFEYMLVPSKRLELLYKEAGDYQKAWFYASVNLEISDSIYVITRKDQVMAETVKQVRSQKEADAEKDRQKIRQGKNQRNMLGGGVVFFIIVSLLAYWGFRNQKRLNRLLDEAKKRSEDLLLNILPHETAEELKLTGKAKAKRFDEVTVMFTDFKNFTQASERMSAEELVDEINFYYCEFDNIISRHNLEKIKIIGDSYMCAGGLPVANDTHALNVLDAAVELQDFMISQKTERLRKGHSYFELRIGIHTGPVVAGIVGHKKFAYDIWGDTVNTASRMENTGEPNRINISGATFAKVKDRYICTYRGKVKAKHKGEIDMYFVGSDPA